jgi:hypothetical protein
MHGSHALRGLRSIAAPIAPRPAGSLLRRGVKTQALEMAALAAVAGTGALAALLSWLDVRRKTAAPELVFQQTSFNQAILDKCPILRLPYTPRRAARHRPSPGGPCRAAAAAARPQQAARAHRTAAARRSPADAASPASLAAAGC